MISKCVSLFLIAFLITSSSCNSSPDHSGVITASEKKESLQANVPVQDLSGYKKATFAAGCFWCEEAVFESIKGVKEAISGYAGGDEKNPTYEEVGSGRTGHAESVEVYYDSTVVNYSTLLRVFFASQDPTQVNGQGPDHGAQYRTIIFYQNASEKAIAEKYVADLNHSGKFSAPIAAQIVPLKKFWPAEDYHQNYVRLHPNEGYVRGESIPRLRKTQQQVPDLIKPERSVLDK